MSLRLRAYPDRGLLVWLTLTAGIAAWAVHLVAFASIVEFVHDNGYFWLFYAGNGVAVAVTLIALALSWAMARAGRDDEEAGTPAGRIRFLGQMGLFVNGINLALILLEGSYIYFLRTGG